MIRPVSQVDISTGGGCRGFVALIMAMILGAIVRLTPALSAGFPLNDGGLFYILIRDLQAAGFQLPLHTSYNVANIPFAYPPLAFYTAGLLDRFVGWNLLDLLRFLPVIASILTIPAFHLLSRSLGLSEVVVTAATIGFALLPRSFQWLIMGGGLTRSFGFLFALLALRYIYLLFVFRQRKGLIPAVILCGLTILSHLEMGWFLAYSTLVLFVVFGRNRVGLIHSILLATGTLVVTAPWWATIIARHGVQTFLTAAQHGWPLYSGIASLFLRGGTLETYVPLLDYLGLLGALSCLTIGKSWLVAWFLSMFLLDPRSAYTTGTVPLALMVGICIETVLLPLLTRFGQSLTTRSRRKNTNRPQDIRPSILLIGVLETLIAYSALNAVADPVGLLAPLPEEERQAMSWIAANTTPDALFLVMAAEEPWAVDRSAEWFPALAKRASASTVQGYEWMNGGVFAKRIERHAGLLHCRYEGVECLEKWLSDADIHVDYVYVPKKASGAVMSQLTPYSECCSALAHALTLDPRYMVVYDRPTVDVFMRR